MQNSGNIVLVTLKTKGAEAMMFTRPQPKSPRILREAMQTLRAECFPGCLFSETTLNKRTDMATYSCMIYIETKAVGKFLFFSYLEIGCKAIVKATLNHYEPHAFELEILPQSNERTYSRILETLYTAINAHNEMHTETQ